MTYEIPVTRARAEFADLINRVVYGDERVVVTRHGKPLVALVSAADLERLDEAQGRAATDAPESGASEETAEQEVLSTLSTVHPLDSTPGSPSRFGIAAHHRGSHGNG
ncbi:type II toxin-antitoxin system Phd/YefM family antitoxin [Streptomyces sp. XM4193]|uniref:type II toxin-antitoxin system Phd/YefM family antitoxin n=1 Tax=Streptomyces sp. XM4193 TaxID=2929782 RepID=UPI001FF79A49|nr:type II toxin-antitoxin system Phd/YefM family antitoxin [Streptomyces sp. XM4193]MCK1797981.1 type II toxin-antitoxin system Phd/YefM family antitoxin [Streptomyces sp. XM4193]